MIQINHTQKYIEEEADTGSFHAKEASERDNCTN